jgi:dTDP-glucose 4,6-dehydratase
LNPLSRDLDHVLVHTEDLWRQQRGQRMFLTGGTGFVGKWLIESLLWANQRLDLGMTATLLTRDPQAFHRQWPHLAGDPAVTLHVGDAATFDYPEGQFPLVVHAASGRYDEMRQGQPARPFDRDVAATRRVLALAGERNTSKFLFTSSGAVYGTQPSEIENVPESYAGAPFPTDLGSAYGHAKRVSEFLCCSHAQTHGFDALVARLFTFAGPYLPLNENYAIGNFIADVLADRSVEIKGDGTPFRSYLYAADLAIWLWTILFRGKPSHPYNVGSADGVTIEELARRLVSETRPATPIHIARRPTPGTPPARYVPSTRRAERELGLHAWIPLEDAVRRMYEWNLGLSDAGDRRR